jgi:hypothetical protein
MAETDASLGGQSVVAVLYSVSFYNLIGITDFDRKIHLIHCIAHFDLCEQSRVNVGMCGCPVKVALHTLKKSCLFTTAHCLSDFLIWLACGQGGKEK